MTVLLGFGDEGFGDGAFGDDDIDPDFAALPTDPPFDIYCTHDDSTTNLLLYPESTYTGDFASEFPDFSNNSLVLVSGGAYAATDARIEVDTAVPELFTWDVEFVLVDLPTNFTNLTTKHCFIGAFDAQGASAGLFVSQIGLVYTGVVHFSGGDLVLDQAIQPLPGSAVLIEENVPYTLRLAVNYQTATTYVFWTRTSDIALIGHQLRYVLPAFITASAITTTTDRTMFSVRGTVTEPVRFALVSSCLGTGLLIPNLRPIADAGNDQAVRSCAIVQLDASGSFDPEKAAITYKWRLVDAPPNSAFAFESLDATTHPELTPTGFTNKVYSIDMGLLHADDAFDVGDVIILAAVTYGIASFGSDGDGFFVTVAEGHVVPDSLSGQAFKVLRQRGLSNSTEINPTFLPDIPGLFKFDLIVFDGELFSTPALTVVNVTSSPLPRGLIPDMKFIWDYLGDFWKMVEDKARIEVFWSALAQMAAAELLVLWQTDYNKNLRDVQRSFQRRWLHYDLLMKESPQLLELSTARAVYGGITSDPIIVGGTDVGGLTLNLFVPFQTDPISFTFTSTSLQGAQQIATRLNSWLSIVAPGITASTVSSSDGNIHVRLVAPFAFSVSGDSTFTLFGTRANTLASGSSGVVTSSRNYFVDTSLTGLDIQEGDFLVVGKGTYRIARVNSAATDSITGQRITLLDDIPLDAGPLWLIAGKTTSLSVDFYDALFSAGDVATLEIVNLVTGELAYASVPVCGACLSEPNSLAIDTTHIGQYLNDPTTFAVYFFSGTRRQYTPVDDLVVDVPYLQELIKNTDDTLVLRRNIDYFLESFRGHKCIRFVVNNDTAFDVWEGRVPPDRLWAETTYLDNRPVIEANFGTPAEFTLDDLSELPDNIDYLSAVRGLWYAYLSGPTLFNVRAGVQILLGLPFAEVASTIEEIRDDFSTTQGRLLLRDVKDTEIVRTYSYPHGLAIDTNPATLVPYVVGDTVKQFAPIVTGAYVADWVKDPTWFAGLLNQGSFAEIEKYAKFLVRVDSVAFNLNALLFVRQFVLRIKPTYLFPLFVVQANLGEAEVSVSDVIGLKGTLTLHAGPFFGRNGQAQMWDQPRPGGGGFWNKFDQEDPNGPPPTDPTPDAHVEWGFDEYFLAPHESRVARLITVWPGGVPIADSIFYADMPVFKTAMDFVTGGVRYIPPSPGIPVGIPVTSSITANVLKIVLMFRCVGDATNLSLEFFVNAVSQGAISVFIPAGDGSPDEPTQMVERDVNFNIAPGDIITLTVYHGTGFNTFMETFGVCLGDGANWYADVSLSADTYQFALPI